MNIKLNKYVAAIIGILLAITVIASGCSPAATLSPTAIPPTPTPDLIGLVKAYEDAFNRHDLEATMALFVDNATYKLGEWYTSVIKQLTSDYHNTLFGLNSVIQNTECTTLNATVSCKVVLHHDCTEAAGMDGDHYTSDYIIENGKIGSFHALELPEDYRALNNLYDPMITWAAKNNPEEWKKIWGLNGSLIYNFETGKIWAKGCRDYAATKP